MSDDETQKETAPREHDPQGDDDALRRLEQRLDRASEAAERLIAQAAERVTRKPPPAGWQEVSPDTDAGADNGSGAGTARSESLLGAEGDLVLNILGALRDRIPPELQRRLADAVREVLLALRALIDWYLERGERRRAGPTEVQDILIL